MTLDGQPVAVTASFDGSVRFWDVPSLREIERLTLPGPVQWVASAGDDHLAVLCSGEAIIYARHK
jgi:WD40 repeat protein